MSPTVVRYALVLLLVTGMGGTADAQTGAPATPLASFLPTFISNAAVNDESNPTFAGAAVDHTIHFIRGANLTLVPVELNKAIASQLAAVPLGSSSGGFVFGINEATGEVTPASTTFGPTFSERALTMGRGRVNLGFTYQRMRYDSYQDHDLDSEAMNFYLEHNNCCPPANNNPIAATDLNPEFERDILQESLALELRQSVSALFANIGLTNRLDLGIAVPFVKLDMSARITTRIHRTSTFANPYVHSFDPFPTEILLDHGRPELQGISDLAHRTLARTGSATGLGDILVRGKYNFLRGESTGAAIGVDLRVPTGDKDNLLGTGATQAKVLFILSGEYGRWSPHVNLGYTKSDGESSALTVAYPDAPAGLVTPTVDLKVPDEINYTAGFEVALTPWMSMGFDTLGRTIRDVSLFEVGTTTFQSRAPGAAPSTSFIVENDFKLLSQRGNINRVLGVAGLRVHVGHRLLMNANMLFPIADRGLRPKPRPTVSFDYLF